MSTTLKFLVGSCQHVFRRYYYKTVLLSKKVCLKFNFRKNNLHHQKARKKTKYKTFKWSPQFFQFLVSYERLKAYFYTSAQGFCAILALFRSLKDQ